MKPVDMMHAKFGKKPGERCGDCPNLFGAYYGDRKVRKCRAYGGLHSSKADWALKWDACGLFGTTCGICGELNEQSEMVRDHGSDTGWLCVDCHMAQHPEYEED